MNGELTEKMIGVMLTFGKCMYLIWKLNPISSSFLFVWSSGIAVSLMLNKSFKDSLLWFIPERARKNNK